MNFAAFERAQVAAFAYKEAAFTGSLDCLRAVCFVLRNRVKAGWGDGTWMSVINSAPNVAAHRPELVWDGSEGKAQQKPEPHLTGDDRLLQMIIRDVDDIYLGQDRMDDSVREIAATIDHRQPALYYAFVNRPQRAWFTENITRNSQDHAHVGNIGPMMLFR
jgi:hypothetical protein